MSERSSNNNDSDSNQVAGQQFATPPSSPRSENPRSAMASQVLARILSAGPCPGSIGNGMAPDQATLDAIAELLTMSDDEEDTNDDDEEEETLPVVPHPTIANSDIFENLGGEVTIPESVEDALFKKEKMPDTDAFLKMVAKDPFNSYVAQLNPTTFWANKRYMEEKKVRNEDAKAKAEEKGRSCQEAYQSNTTSLFDARRRQLELKRQYEETTKQVQKLEQKDAEHRQSLALYDARIRVTTQQNKIIDLLTVVMDKMHHYHEYDPMNLPFSNLEPSDLPRLAAQCNVTDYESTNLKVAEHVFIKRVLKCLGFLYSKANTVGTLHASNGLSRETHRIETCRMFSIQIPSTQDDSKAKKNKKRRKSSISGGTPRSKAQKRLFPASPAKVEAMANLLLQVASATATAGNPTNGESDSKKPAASASGKPKHSST